MVIPRASKTDHVTVRFPSIWKLERRAGTGSYITDSDRNVREDRTAVSDCRVSPCWAASADRKRGYDVTNCGRDVREDRTAVADCCVC